MTSHIAHAYRRWDTSKTRKAVQEALVYGAPPLTVAVLATVFVLLLSKLGSKKAAQAAA